MISTSYVDFFTKCILVLFLLFVSSCSRSSLYTPKNDASKNIPITDSSTISPGLKVRYYEEKYQHITDMPKGNQLVKFGKEGKIVYKLDNVYSKRSNVFDSGKSRLVGFWFHGVVHLEKPGLYQFQALANDGVRFFLNQQLIFEDPFKHSDRLTPVGRFQVEKPGWYPIQILFFQRKGTSALRFYWKKPEGDSFQVIPAAALGHLSDS